MSESKTESKPREKESDSKIEKGPSKEELVKDLQEIFELPEVHFEKLSRAELLSLTRAIMNVGNLFQTGQRVLKARLQEKISEEIANARPLERLLAENSGGGKGGPLGMGVLPRLRKGLLGGKT